MPPLDAANVIRVFDFYLAAMFVLGLSRRYAVYWDTVALLVALRGRWPKLVTRLKEHHGVLVTGNVLRPMALAAGLTVGQMICSRVIFPAATLTVGEIRTSWWMAGLVLVAALPMLAVDVYFLVRVGAFDRRETVKYLDLAEHWLNSWKAPAIRLATFGYVDPRRIVDVEVRASLTQLGMTVQSTAWWVAAQVGCRVACGLAIWLLWAAVGA